MSSQVNVEYENLKKNIIVQSESTSSLELEKIKDHFSSIINSKRKLSQTKNLKDIIHLLEERDALDCNDVSTLKDIGELLQNEDLFNLVSLYDKCHEPEPCLCGKEYKYNTLPIINTNQRKNHSLNVSNELQEAIINIAWNIGENWRVLASELHVRECHVDEVRNKYPNDYQKQAQKILEVWIKDNKEEATLDNLKCALEKRLCKMEGLGIHMMKRIISVE